jgi:hypothetical protein
MEPDDNPLTVRVVMARSVADRWLRGHTRSEYRFTVFGFQSPAKAKRFASSLRSIRDRQLRVSSHPTHLPVIADLGVKEKGDAVELWSSNVEALRKIARWAESAGMNTDFIW